MSHPNYPYTEADNKILSAVHQKIKQQLEFIYADVALDSSAEHLAHQLIKTMRLDQDCYEAKPYINNW